MKTYLVPVDFSETSVHAAEFAASLSAQTGITNIILLNSYYVSIYETILPTPDLILPTPEEIEDRTDERLAKLNKLKNTLNAKGAAGLTVKTIVSRLPLLRAVIETIATEGVDLVILGSNGNTSTDESHVGANVVSISKNSPVPVVVVPPACCYTPVRRIVMACDFKKVNEAIPLESLKRILDRYNMELLVVNVDPDEKKCDDPKVKAEELTLHKMLENYHPQYHYICNKDVINGITRFATEHDAQLVIALPHRYSFLQSLLHDSVSEKLTVHSAVPVLLLK